MCITDCHDMTLTVKVVKNPNTTIKDPERDLKTLWEKEENTVISPFPPRFTIHLTLYHTILTLNDPGEEGF